MLSSLEAQIPSWWDLGAMIGYLRSNPYLFISSSTVMTSGILGMVLLAGMVVTASRVLGVEFWYLKPGRSLLNWMAPKLALILAWFGLGSMVLATEILLRFHHSIPVETEIQFRSGLGHLVVAVAGITLLWPLLRRRTKLEWLQAHFWALGYWILQIVFLTPPWFEFQGQGDPVFKAAKTALGFGLLINAIFYVRNKEKKMR